MPVLDFPLEKLQTYTGINPRPDDFDAYWDRALAELRAVEPAIELRPAAFQAPQAECSQLFFTGVGGARIHAKLLRPRCPGGGSDQGAQGARGERRRRGLVCFHGYSGNSGNWTDYLSYAGAGFVVAALDCRGQAGLSEDVGGVRGTTHSGQIIRGLDDAPEKLLFRAIFLDAAQLAGIVMAMPEVDPERVGAMGGSQGGGLTLACAALEPRIRRAAPCFPFLSDYLRVWEMDQAANAYAELRTFLRHFDPLAERRREIFTRLGYIDVAHLAPRIRAEVLMAITLMDNVCPPSTQFAAFNKIAAPKRSLVYPDFAHEQLPVWGDEAFQFMVGM